jgi:hypothetical protein
MNKKEKMIEEFLAEPIKAGDVVTVRGLGTQDKKAFANSTKVIEVHDDESITINEYHYPSPKRIQKGDYRKNTDRIGADPFPEKSWYASLRMIMFDLYSITHACGMQKLDKEYDFGTKNTYIVNELNWNPFFIDKDGNEIVYQRELCWTTKQKQLLIESIYNDIEIGKIVIRRRSYDWVKNRCLSGKEAFFKDIVDGKQRLNAILGFINGEFKDLHGNKWNDLSDHAQHKFFKFSSVGYGEIGENATDEDVKSVFLNINFAGVKMSKEHIDFVKSIQIK